MKYKISKDGARELIAQMIYRCSQIEVKGDSVSHVFILNNMLNELYNSLEEIPDEKNVSTKEGVIKNDS